MTEILLTGLEGGTPIGAMAALGALRVCAQLSEHLGEARLSWRQTPVWRPVLHLTAEITQERLIEALLAHQTGRSQYPAFTWADDLKVPVEALAAACQNNTDRIVLDFMAAYGSDLVKAETKDQLKPTPFHMTSGQQRFLAMVREVNAELDPQVVAGRPRRKRDGDDALAPMRAAVSEALFGPWRYREKQHSLGWDPAAERLHALRAQSPTSEDPYGVKAAVWLAAESLPFFPCAIGGGRLRTGGFGLRDHFTWPIWRSPLTVDGVRSLLLLAELGAEAMPSSLKHRGVEVVYRAQRVPLGDKGYAIFRPASPVPYEARGEADG